MKKIIAIAALLSAGSFAFAQEAAQKPSYSVTVDFPFVTKYVFRGEQLDDAVIQPSVKITQGNAYAGIWFNVPVATDAGDSQEVDFYAGYMLPLSDTIKADVGATVYVYPEADAGDSTTTEVYAGLNFSVAGFSPSVYGFYDFQNETWVFQGSVGYSLPLEDMGTSLDLTATVGHVADEGVYYADTYTYFQFGAAVPYKLSENTKVTIGTFWSGNNADFMDDAEFGGSLSITSGF